MHLQLHLVLFIGVNFDGKLSEILLSTVVNTTVNFHDILPIDFGFINLLFILLFVHILQLFLLLFGLQQDSLKHLFFPFLSIFLTHISHHHLNIIGDWVKRVDIESDTLTVIISHLSPLLKQFELAIPTHPDALLEFGDVVQVILLRDKQVDVDVLVGVKHHLSPQLQVVSKELCASLVA